MKVGRPTEYSEDILTQIDEYIEQCEDEMIQVVKQSSEKYDMFDNKLKVNLPSLAGLAIYLGVHRDTLYEWESLENEDGTKKYPEFSDKLEHVRALQEVRLVNNGLSGDYNPTISKLLLTSKHGYKDRQDNTTDDKPIESLPSVINVVKPTNEHSHE